MCFCVVCLISLFPGCLPESTTNCLGPLSHRGIQQLLYCRGNLFVSNRARNNSSDKAATTRVRVSGVPTAEVSHPQKVDKEPQRQADTPPPQRPRSKRNRPGTPESRRLPQRRGSKRTGQECQRTGGRETQTTPRTQQNSGAALLLFTPESATSQGERLGPSIGIHREQICMSKPQVTPF